MLILLCIIASLIGLVVLAYTAAQKKQQATLVGQDRIEFVTAGGRLIRVLENINGIYYEKKESEYETNYWEKDPAAGIWKSRKVSVKVTGGLIPSEEDYTQPFFDSNAKNLMDRYIVAPRKWFRWQFRTKLGLYWVSILYPQIKVHKPLIHKARVNPTFKPGTPLAGENGKPGWLIVDEKPVEVEDLRWIIERPILVADAEFKDNLTANIAVMAIIRIVVPRIPVFTLGGKFLQIVDSVIQSAVNDYTLRASLNEFTSTMPKGRGSNFFPEVLGTLNVGKLKSKKTPDDSGTIVQLGIELVDAWIVEFEQVQDKDAQAALRKKELNRLNGEADVLKEKLAADASEETARRIRLTGEAEADVLKAKRDKAGAAVTIAELEVKQMEALRGSGVSTYVKGDGVKPVLPIN